MKREGRQHGLVRSYMVSTSPTPRTKKIANKIDSPPTAGIFQRVPTKPTNHSKFTGKCGRPRCSGCHDHPVSKSRDKAKGTQKLKSVDVLVNHRLVDWRLKGKVDGFGSIGNLDDSYGDFWGDSDDGITEGELEEVCQIPVAFSGGSELVSGVVEEEGVGVDWGFVGFVVDSGDEEDDWCIVGEI